MIEYVVEIGNEEVVFESENELSPQQLQSYVGQLSGGQTQASQEFEVEEGDPKVDEDQNFLFDVLDNVNRLQYGSANVIHKALVEKDYDFAKNYWEGLTLDEKKSVGDTLHELIKPESTVGKIAVTAASYAGDVATDPLTYIGVGLVNRAGKLIKAGSTTEKLTKAKRATGLAKDTKAKITFAGKPIPGSQVIAEPASRGLAKLGKTIREDLGPVSDAIDTLTSVSTKLRPKDVDPVTWQKFLKARDKSNIAGEAAKLSAVTKAKNLMKQMRDEGLDDDAIADLTNKIETKQAVTSQSGKQAKEIQSELQDTYKDLGDAGKEIIDAPEYSYVPHVLTKKSKEVRESLGQVGFKSRVFSTDNPSDIQRTILKYTDESGDDFIVSTKTGLLMKDGKKAGKLTRTQLDKVKNGELGNLDQASIKDINKAYGEPVFKTNLPELLAIQGLRQAKVVKGDTMFKEVAKIASKVPKKENGVDWVESSVPDLAGKYVPKEVEEHLTKSIEKLINPEEVNNIWKGLKKATEAWKTQATFWNVAFHSRNMISNVFQNSLAGVTNPDDYMSAWNVIVRKGGKDLSGDDARIFKEYQKQGLDQIGHMSGDIEQAMKHQINNAFDFAKEGKIHSAFHSGSSWVGKSVEDIAKFAHYKAKRREGLSSFDAGQSVKKYLFDYSDLTDVERNVFKVLLPFYTFTRKNIPVQLETLFKNPGRQARVIKAKNNIEILTGDEGNEEILPDWLKNAAPIYVGKKDGKSRYVKLEGFLPVADLNKIEEPAQQMLNMFNPILKGIGEQLANRDFFRDDVLTRQEGVKGFTGYGEKDFFWTQIPGRLNHLARLFRPFAEAEKIFGKRASGDSNMKKFGNLLAGGKLYEYDERELLKRFDLKTEDEARNLKRKINELKRQINRIPETREANKKRIKMLNKMMQKAKKESAIKRKNARRKMKG